MKAASTNENIFLKALELEEGSIAAFDKGFNRYMYFKKWTDSKRFFVTWLKDNAKYEVISTTRPDHPDILKGQLIELKYKENKLARTVQLRWSHIVTLFQERCWNS